MKIIFAGTPPFAAVALEALIGAGYQITVVLTQPDRPAGRGMKPVSRPVKSLALQHGLPCCNQPRSSNPSSIRNSKPSTRMSWLWRLMGSSCLPPSCASQTVAASTFTPHYYRDGEALHLSSGRYWREIKETGITIMQMDKGLDTGAILLQRSVSIEAMRLPKLCMTNLRR